MTPESRFLPIIESSTSNNFAVMALRPLPAVTSSTRCTRLIMVPRKNVSWKDGRQLTPLAGVADLEPGPLLDTSSSTRRRALLEAILSDTPAPTPLPCNARVQHVTVPDPVTARSMDSNQLLPPPECLDPFIDHLRDETVPPCDESENHWPSLHTAPLHVLCSND